MDRKDDALTRKPFRTCIEVIVRIITTYGFNGALDAIQVQVLLMGIEPSMGITLCCLPVFLRLVSYKARTQGVDTVANRIPSNSSERVNRTPVVATTLPENVAASTLSVQ